MSDFNAVANTPVDMLIAGKTYKIRRVPLGTIFGNSEAAVISTWMRQVQAIAATLQGDEKTSYLAKVTADMPTGDKLNKMAEEYLRSVSGIQMVVYDALRRDQPNIEQELAPGVLMSEEPATITSLVEFITGRMDDKASPPLPRSAARAGAR